MMKVISKHQDDLDILTKEIVDPATLVRLAKKVEEQGVVVVHVFFPPQADEYAIRVWKSTYLISRSSSHQSRLLHADNIAIAPSWTEVNSNQAFGFTLYFEAMPSSVVVFDLVEAIPEPGGFLHRNIVRNESDVYSIRG